MAVDSEAGPDPSPACSPLRRKPIRDPATPLQPCRHRQPHADQGRLNQTPDQGPAARRGDSRDRPGSPCHLTARGRRGGLLMSFAIHQLTCRRPPASRRGWPGAAWPPLPGPVRPAQTSVPPSSGGCSRAAAANRRRRRRPRWRPDDHRPPPRPPPATSSPRATKLPRMRGPRSAGRSHAHRATGTPDRPEACSAWGSSHLSDPLPGSLGPVSGGRRGARAASLPPGALPPAAAGGGGGVDRKRDRHAGPPPGPVERSYLATPGGTEDSKWAGGTAAGGEGPLRRPIATQNSAPTTPRTARRRPIASKNGDAIANAHPLTPPFRPPPFTLRDRNRASQGRTGAPEAPDVDRQHPRHDAIERPGGPSPTRLPPPGRQRGARSGVRGCNCKGDLWRLEGPSGLAAR